MSNVGIITRPRQVPLFPMEVTPHKAVRFVNSSAENVAVYSVNVRGRLSRIFDLLKRK
jgi:hypothetical protein